MTFVMRYNNQSHLSGLLPHNNSREGFTTPHHGHINLGEGSRPSSSSSSSRLNDVKVGLRHAIHSRRALSHNPIISSEDLAPRNIQFKLTPEEEEKRKIRREKNKVAASKCRNKRREQITTTKKEYEQVSQSNSTMEREIERLRQERHKLQQTLNQHQCALQQQQQMRSLTHLNNPRPSSSLRGGPLRPSPAQGFQLQPRARDERGQENVRRLF